MKNRVDTSDQRYLFSYGVMRVLERAISSDYGHWSRDSDHAIIPGK